MKEMIFENKMALSALQKMFDYRLSRLRQSMAKQDVSLAILLNPVSLRYAIDFDEYQLCLLYTSPSPRDATLSRMPSSA